MANDHVTIDIHPLTLQMVAVQLNVHDAGQGGQRGGQRPGQLRVEAREVLQRG